jgi:hypothetical protein
MNAGVLILLVVLSAPLVAGTQSRTVDSLRVALPLSTPSDDSDSQRVSIPSSNETPQVKTARLAIVAGALAAGITTIHLYQANGWWKDNRSAFHFQEDLRYGLSVDKLGHFYGTAVLTFVFKKSLEWCSFSEESALHWGAGASALFQTYVEIEDGFHTWGFDRVDFATDLAGAAYPIAQYYWPYLRNFNFKFSYHASPLLNTKGLDVGFKGQKHIILDDYEGQTIWLSLRMNDLLPAVAQVWPDWLCLAFGYGARDVGTAGGAYSVYFLALDFDVTKIIPQDTPFLRTLSESLNFIHLPAPAVRFSPGIVWYGLYF